MFLSRLKRTWKAGLKGKASHKTKCGWKKRQVEAPSPDSRLETLGLKTCNESSNYKATYFILCSSVRMVRFLGQCAENLPSWNYSHCIWSYAKKSFISPIYGILLSWRRESSYFPPNIQFSRATIISSFNSRKISVKLICSMILEEKQDFFQYNEKDLLFTINFENWHKQTLIQN